VNDVERKVVDFPVQEMCSISILVPRRLAVARLTTKYDTFPWGT